MSKQLPLILWLLSAPLIFAPIFGGPVERAQEARVLETAREMVGQGWKSWLVPHCNGRVRLHKPPLAYWLAAGSFKIFGVHDWAGRVPFALSQWLTLAATYAAARPILGRRAALLASAALPGTYFFIRLGRFAETDVLASFFVTAAIAAIIQGALAKRFAYKALGFLAAGALLGLTVMAKGPQVVFPPLFVIGFAWMLRRWQILWQFLLLATPAAALVALPWWIYIYQLPEFKVVAKELSDVAEGVGHHGPIWFYFLVALLATLPWCGFMVMGVVEWIDRFRRELRARIGLLWIACIIIPLSLVPQKQDHYILPLLPPLLVAAGWTIDQGLRGRERMVRINLILFAASAIACVFACALPIMLAKEFRGKNVPADYLLAAMLLVAGVLLFISQHSPEKKMLPLRRILTVFAVATVLMIVGVAFWRPALEPIDYPNVAARIKRDFDDRDMVFYANENLPLCFYLNRTVHYYATRDEVAQVLVRRPNLLIIWEPERLSETPPPGKEIERIHMRKHDIVIYEQK